MPFLKDIMDWGAARKVPTKDGPRVVRSAPITDEFWKLWEKNKDALKEVGISVNKHKGVWQVSWWQTQKEAAADIVDTPADALSTNTVSAPSSITQEDAVKLVAKYRKEQAEMH